MYIEGIIYDRVDRKEINRSITKISTNTNDYDDLAIIFAISKKYISKMSVANINCLCDLALICLTSDLRELNTIEILELIQGTFEK